MKELLWIPYDGGNMSEINNSRQVAIQVSGVKKMYRLGQIGGGTLQADLQSWWARILGKEDPNKKIGENQRSNGETFMALNGIDLTIYQGEAVGIIGSNGAGKSTLLKLLSRVTAPSEGEIDIYGRIASMLEVGTGFNGELTGRENVYMNGAILGMTKTEIDAKMEQIIEFSEIREFIDTPVKRYSSGMFVKLAFSVAAHLDSEIMIMDEVLAVGDMAFQEKCLSKMRESAKQEGRTVLYVSHNMNTIRQLCDRCIVLNKGKVVFNGNVEEAISVYIHKNYNLQSFYNINKLIRPSDQCKKLKAQSLEFLEKDSPIYKSKENLVLGVRWEAFDDISNLCFRIVFRTTTLEPIGMAEVNRYCSAKKGETIIDRFEFDISYLPEGNYTFFFVFYEIGSGGNNQVLDGPPIDIPFKSENYNKNGLKWDHKCWGNIRFPGIVCRKK